MIRSWIRKTDGKFRKDKSKTKLQKEHAGKNRCPLQDILSVNSSMASAKARFIFVLHQVSEGTVPA